MAVNNYSEESKKYVKPSKHGYLKLGFSSFYKDYYTKQVEQPLSKTDAKSALTVFFQKLYKALIVDKYKFKIPVIGDLFYVSETSKPGGSTYINWKKTRQARKIVRETNIGLSGRKPYFKHERAQKVRHDSFYQLTPIEGKREGSIEGSRGLWRHINNLLKDPTIPPYRANL